MEVMDLSGKGQMTMIDVGGIAEATQEEWINYDLCDVNDCVVRMGVFLGEFHWHHHDREDEFFFVVSGKLHLDLDNRTVELLPGQGFTVPRGARHRTRADERTVVLMVEGNTVKPEGDLSRNGTTPWD